MLSGTVSIVDDLQNILNPKPNEAYLVSSVNEIYGYTADEGWISLGSIFNITIIENKLKQELQANIDAQLKTHITSITLTHGTIITNEYTVILPLKYQVR